jgi:hypothetical protein
VLIASKVPESLYERSQSVMTFAQHSRKHDRQSHV